MKVFHGFGYRTSSRFADYVKIQVEDQKITVSGPRVSPSVYRAWIIAQFILLWSIIPVLLVGIILWDWKYFVAIAGLFLLHYLVSILGAVILWSAANAYACMSPKFPAATFNVNEVKTVKIGAGWARDGLRFVIPEFIPLLNRMAKGFAVSFEAPDGDLPKDVTYAIHMPSKNEAKELANLLDIS